MQLRRRDRGFPGLALDEWEDDGVTAKLDLTLLMMETEQQLLGAIEYNTNLFDADMIARMASHLGQGEQCTRHLQLAVQLNPQNEQAQEFLAALRSGRAGEVTQASPTVAAPSRRARSSAPTTQGVRPLAVMPNATSVAVRSAAASWAFLSGASRRMRARRRAHSSFMAKGLTR